MKNYLKKKFIMSDEGTSNLQKSIISHTFYNISLMFPMIIAMLFIQQYVNKFLGNNYSNISISYYLILIVIFALIIFIISVIDYNYNYTKIYVESEKTRIKLAEKLRELPLAYFARKDLSDLSATIMTDVTIIEHLFSHSIPQAFASIISVSIITIMLFIYNWKMTLSLFWVVPLAAIVLIFSLKTQKKAHKASFKQNRSIIDYMQDSFDLSKEITSYNLEDMHIKEMNNKLDVIHKMMISSELTIGAFINLSVILLKLGLGSVTVVGAYLLSTDSIDIITYVIFLIISASIYSPIMEIINNLAELLYMSSITERIREIDNMPIQTGSKDFKPNGYDIVFEDVHFSYDADIPVLNGISFTAKQGEVTALVGPSGCGKTTATKLAARFWDIDSGKISIGGVDISKIEPETLLQKFSIVFQDVTLFNESIMENIRLGRKDASDEDVIRVSKLARCDGFINKLPDKYNTLIGENGEKLSGGERQRISIARALLKDAPIILLDEATASLDAENETLIQAAISELIKDKTVIIIAHRMRTVMDAGNIIVLQEGKVLEQGNSNDLIVNNNLFKKMYNSQL